MRYTIEDRGIPVLVEKNGGCQPATIYEIAFFEKLAAANALLREAQHSLQQWTLEHNFMPDDDAELLARIDAHLKDCQ